MSYRVLLVDDEEDILDFVSYNLKQQGWEVQTATNGLEGIKVAQEFHPHLILLDVMMDGMDGMQVCSELRQIPELSQTIIAMLTARGEDYSQIAGFSVGADDYITKPIRPNVLVSRLKALLKRVDLTVNKDMTPSVSDELVIDRNQYLVFVKGVEVSLPRKEFELLALLHSKPSKVFGRDEIFNAVWGDNVFSGDRTIDVHIRKLREKIGDDYIVTVKGVGYKFMK